MKFYLQFLVVAAVVCLGVIADNKALLTCISGKYQNDLGNSFGSCYERSRALGAEKVKNCYRDAMIDAQVVTVKNRQMTVDRTKFGAWADANRNTVVGKAMKTCYDGAPQGDNMYKEAARASQCVFGNVKKTC